MEPSELVAMRVSGMRLGRPAWNGGLIGALLWGLLCLLIGTEQRGLAQHHAVEPVEQQGGSSPQPCERIVSLAPSLTELAFSIGLGPSVVAVTDYDRYPPAVTTLPSVGGALDASPERIASFRPTMVLALAEMPSIVAALEKVHIATVVVDHRSVAGILDSMTLLGDRCQRSTEAAKLRGDREDLIKNVRDRASGRGERVLVTVVSASSLTDLSQVQVSGTDGFYAELITITGAVPVVTTPSISLASMSMEGIVTLRPSVIFEVFERPLRESEREVRKRWWSEWSMIPAVAHNRIIFLDADYAGIPGPRFDRLLRAIEHAVSSTGE